MIVSTRTKQALHQLKLRFFDLDVYLRSDSDTHLGIFEKLYDRFQLNDLEPQGETAVEITLLTSSNNAWDQPVLIVGEEVWPLRHPRLLESYVYNAILHNILMRVRSHFLIHAGVVAKNGQAVILVADSFHGKTTLVLELIRRGFEFLSDETAALGRIDKQVHPFPRSLRIREGSLELTGFTEMVAEAPTYLGKYLLDVEAIRPNCVGQASAIRHIVVLQNPDNATNGQPNEPPKEVGVLVDHLSEPLLEAVRQLEDVTDVQVSTEYSYPAIQFYTTREMFILSQIDNICQEHQALLLEIINRADQRPSFKTPAHLEPLSNSECVLELLRRFQGGHKSALLEKEFGGSSARLYLELATLIDQADCHHLFVGPLQQTADLVCGLVSSKE